MSSDNIELYGYERPPVPFNFYRQILDQETGLIRHGIEDLEIYESCLRHDCSILGASAIGFDKTVIAAPNDVLHLVEESSQLCNKLFATLPSNFLIDYNVPMDLIYRDRVSLSVETTEKIFLGDPSFQSHINLEIEGYANSNSRIHAGESTNEYMFFTKYDLRATHDKFSAPAEDIETPNGFIVSTRPEEIKRCIPEIIKLQGEVFSAQAIQTGYFAGLSDEGTLEIIQNPEFIPIIARDKKTDEVVMCTLFAPDFTDFEALPWINPNEVGRHLMQGEVPDCLTLPLVVISKNSGLGLLKYAVQMALHETVYRKKPRTVGVMYESNPISVFITPRTIHGQITRGGGVCLSKYAEVYFYNQLK